MKKTLFLGLSVLIGFNASAQYKNASLLAPKNFEKPTIGSVPSKDAFRNSNKKTRGGTIYLNYIEFMAAKEGIAQATLDANSSLYYQFPDSSMRFNPPNQGYGISYKSAGQVMHPGAQIYNDFTPAGEIFIGNQAFTVDSVFVLGSYAKVTAAVDTLIMSLVHSGGTNMPISGFSGQQANFGVDTTRFAVQSYNIANFNSGPYQSNIVGQPAAYTVTRPLSNADSNAYVMGANSYNLRYIGFSGNSFAVPAGEIVSVSFTFKPGFSWAPGDTIGNNNKYLFLSYEPNGDNTFMPYYPGDYNMSSVVTKDTSNNWGGDYIPTLAFTAPFSSEVHDIVWKLSCPTCGTVGTADLESNIEYVVSPNPATDNIHFSLRLTNSAKNVSISLTNLVGQQVKNINVGAVNANDAKSINLNVSDLHTGLYIYTINADGDKLSNKILVK